MTTSERALYDAAHMVDALLERTDDTGAAHDDEAYLRRVAEARRDDAALRVDGPIRTLLEPSRAARWCVVRSLLRARADVPRFYRMCAARLCASSSPKTSASNKASLSSASKKQRVRSTHSALQHTNAWSMATSDDDNDDASNALNDSDVTDNDDDALDDDASDDDDDEARASDDRAPRAWSSVVSNSRPSRGFLLDDEDDVEAPTTFVDYVQVLHDAARLNVESFVAYAAPFVVERAASTNDAIAALAVAGELAAAASHHCVATLRALHAVSAPVCGGLPMTWMGDGSAPMSFAAAATISSPSSSSFSSSSSSTPSYSPSTSTISSLSSSPLTFLGIPRTTLGAFVAAIDANARAASAFLFARAPRYFDERHCVLDDEWSRRSLAAPFIAAVARAVHLGRVDLVRCALSIDHVRAVVCFDAANALPRAPPFNAHITSQTFDCVRAIDRARALAELVAAFHPTTLRRAYATPDAFFEWIVRGAPRTFATATTQCLLPLSSSSSLTSSPSSASSSLTSSSSSSPLASSSLSSSSLLTSSSMSCMPALTTTIDEDMFVVMSRACTAWSPIEWREAASRVSLVNGRRQRATPPLVRPPPGLTLTTRMHWSQ